jgi:hypothetical protein
MKKCTVLKLIYLMTFAGTVLAQSGTKGPGLVKETSTDKPVYHALLIGVSNYDTKSLSLQYPASDVKNLSVILKKYDFRDQNLTQLPDPSKEKIMDGIEQLRKRTRPNDNVLVYVSLHGRQSESDLKYYWLPADAEDEKPSSWISVEDFITLLGTIPNQNLLLIADVCYGGKIFDSTPTILLNPIKTKSGATASAFIPPPLSQRQVETFKSKTSSKAISSGTDLQQVPDKSIFAEQLCYALTKYKYKYLLTSDLFQYVYKQVTEKDDSTIPVYGFIRQHKKDIGGDFLFYNPTGSDEFHTPPSPPGVFSSRKATEVGQGIEEVPLHVTKGQTVKIKADGSIYTGNYVKYSTPVGKEYLDGLPFPILDSYDIVGTYPHAALMYRVAPEEKWKLCGNSCMFTVPKDGLITIELLVNDKDQGNNKGSYSVEILTK